MIKIYKYLPDDRQVWDNLIRSSKNGTFILTRDYMDYHSDRFQDCSFIFTKKNKVVCVIPGNIEGEVYYSHKGLTYGGFISNYCATVADHDFFLKLLNEELRRMNLREVVYKAIPYIYHASPSQEDIYALFKLGAKKIGCNISSVILNNVRQRFSELRRRGVKKALKEGITIMESDKYDSFWEILCENLITRYSVTPVHGIGEIQYLSQSFPENIKLYMAYHCGEPVAGAVLFITPQVIRVQYISSNENGRKKSALDLLFNYLINEVYCFVPYFDLGTSNGNNGYYLNEKLIFQKEGIGGRGVVYESYSYNL